jgi:hypothetical protein
MPSINAGALEDCLTRKLQAVEVTGRDRKFEIYDDEQRLIARTAMSRGWRGTTPISANMVSNIKTQLHLPRSSDLVALVACTVSREDYLSLFS